MLLLSTFIVDSCLSLSNDVESILVLELLSLLLLLLSLWEGEKCQVLLLEGLYCCISFLVMRSLLLDAVLRMDGGETWRFRRVDTEGEGGEEWRVRDRGSIEESIVFWGDLVSLLLLLGLFLLFRYLDEKMGEEEESGSIPLLPLKYVGSWYSWLLLFIQLLL